MDEETRIEIDGLKLKVNELGDCVRTLQQLAEQHNTLLRELANRIEERPDVQIDR